MKLPIYLDHSATTPMDPKVLDVMLPYFLENFGNASSSAHVYGWLAEEAVEIAREQVAALIGARSDEIVFTSGATESVNLAIKGFFETQVKKGGHIITSKTEHRAVLDTCAWVEANGGSVTYMDVTPDGLVDLQKLENEITDKTKMIAIMYANNETGVVQPVKEISLIADKYKVTFFTDATQAVGKIPVDVKADGIDMLAMTAHKLYGPKGVGALYVKKKEPKIQIEAQMLGGRHEKNRRSGTLNVPGIAGFGSACDIAAASIQDQKITILRNKLENALMAIPGSVVNGAHTSRLPHITNISFQDVEGESLLIEFCREVAVSRGSACSSVTNRPSHVLTAMGITDELALSSFRMSLGRFTTDNDIEQAISHITSCVERHQQNLKLR